jgi:hypothetical protein
MDPEMTLGEKGFRDLGGFSGGVSGITLSL